MCWKQREKETSEYNLEKKNKSCPGCLFFSQNEQLNQFLKATIVNRNLIGFWVSEIDELLI